MTSIHCPFPTEMTLPHVPNITVHSGAQGQVQDSRCSTGITRDLPSPYRTAVKWVPTEMGLLRWLIHQGHHYSAL